jgi:hypothetical protein
MLDVIFVIHVLVEFRTAYVDVEQKTMVLSARLVAARCGRHTFISLIPTISKQNRLSTQKVRSCLSRIVLIRFAELI